MPRRFYLHQRSSPRERRMRRRRIALLMKKRKWKKTVIMVYKFIDGPILYSLYAFGVEEDKVFAAGGGKELKTGPFTLFQMSRDEYPTGMGFVFLESSNTLYMIGGQFKKDGILYSSKKVFSLDLTPLTTVSSSSSSSSFSSTSLSIQECPRMNVGKTNPIVVLAAGKIYVLSSSIEAKYDPNTEILGPVSCFEDCDYDDMTAVPLAEEDCVDMTAFPLEEEEDGDGDDICLTTTTKTLIFEVYNPESGEWTVLPNPPNYQLWWCPTLIVGHVFIHDKIILNSFDSTMFCFDVNTLKWEYSYFPIIVKEPTEYYSTLMHHFYQFGFPGRGCILKDYNALFTFNGLCKELYAYSIPTRKDATNFSYGAVNNLDFYFNFMDESTGGLNVGAELVHLGCGIICILTRDDDDFFFFTYGMKPIEERPKRDVTATIAEVVQYKLAGKEVHWRAKTVNKTVLQKIDAKFGTFVYCFAL